MTDSKKQSRRERFEARKAELKAEHAEKQAAIRAEYDAKLDAGRADIAQSKAEMKASWEETKKAVREATGPIDGKDVAQALRSASRVSRLFR